MDREQIRGVLKAIFEEETGETLPTLADDAVLAEDFSLDSVDLVSLLMRVEAHFQVHLSNAELTESGTVGALIDLVGRKVGEAAGAAPHGRAAA